MNELQIIDERELLGVNFKVYGTFENPLFLAKDVAVWIDYTKKSNGSYDVNSMLRMVDEDEKLIRKIFVSGQNREMWFLTEDGFYEVCMQSTKPNAKIFKKEVKQILKTIRKTGNYISQNYINNNFIELEKEKIKIEKSKILKELSQSISNEKYKETLTIYSANALYDTPILQLPAIERKSYSAGELSQIIMNDYGIKISSKRIGMIANENNLKTKENGYYAYDKSKHSNKQVESFRYYENVINEIMKYIN